MAWRLGALRAPAVDSIVMGSGIQHVYSQLVPAHHGVTAESCVTTQVEGREWFLQHELFVGFERHWKSKTGCDWRCSDDGSP